MGCPRAVTSCPNRLFRRLTVFAVFRVPRSGRMVNGVIRDRLDLCFGVVSFLVRMTAFRKHRALASGPALILVRVSTIPVRH